MENKKTSKTTNTNNTTPTTAKATGNAKYQANAVNHGYSHCVLNNENGFIVAYGNKEQADKLLAIYGKGFSVVAMLEDTRVSKKVSDKLAAKKARLEAQMAKLKEMGV